MPITDFTGREKAQVMNAEEMRRALLRIAHEILEQNHKHIGDLVLVGVKSRGDIIAHRIAENLERIENIEVDVGAIDVTLYRDDLNLYETQMQVNSTELPFDVRGKWVILVDEVLYTGRTVRAAMDALMDFGRPAAIQLATLIDRGHRELPIAADYVGKNVPTSRKEFVQVQLTEEHGRDAAIIYEREDE
ncbi:bifunctional pyr operon transcriptional regulator/uracil phosphoribosyltransferase PyrR [Candidatus Poribacteria bacterium]|nr:MAG: bifunctional pyr operon transcriptional regulator/uracil phosphoribosyltransferase PyrR [Candidatus Poribacteria bacterium]